MKNYSVVIVARDSPRPLLGTLLALRKYAQPAEVVLVDNASVHDLTPIAALAQLPIRAMRLTEHVSLSTAYNRGLDVVETDAVLLLHSDVLVESNPQSLVDVLTAHPAIGVVAGKLLYNGPAPRRLQHVGYEVGRGRTAPRPVGRGEWDRWREQRDVPAVSDACMLVRRTPGLRFDERYWFRLQDVDLCMQYRQRGYRVVSVPDFRAVHLENGGAQFARRQTVWAARELASHWLYHERWCQDAELSDMPRMDAVRGEAALQYLVRVDEDSSVSHATIQA